GGAGGFTYEWVTGNTTDTLTVDPSSNTTYTIYATDNTGCIDSAEANVTVNSLPLVLLNAETYSVCTTDTSDTLAGSPSGGTYAGPNLTGNIFHPNLAGTGTFNFTYTYTDSAGCTAVGNQSIIVSICTGIQTMLNSQRIAVYPNPANSEFTVELQSGDAAQLLQLYTVTGQLVYEHQYASTENSQLSFVNTQALSNGVYFLKVALKDGSTLVQKVDIVK
ncbi:MAG TPA: T9SS type A sorting domain-containing protein, partial [Bacteroidia bacterium]|nr:T9SS type A sorting domain-containing protein [Bacteroidia bacterium]